MQYTLVHKWYALHWTLSAVRQQVPSIFPKLDCMGCGCMSVDFDVSGVYLSGAAKWGSQVHLPKKKLRQKTLIEDDYQTGKCKLHSLPKPCTPPGVLKKLISLLIHFQLYVSCYIFFSLVSKTTSCLIKCHYLLKSGFEFPPFEWTPRRNHFPTLPGDSIFVHWLSIGWHNDPTLKRKIATGEHN